MTRSKEFLFRLCALLLTLGISLLLIEVGLRIYSRLRSSYARAEGAIDKAIETKDPKLRFRLPPNAPGHDAWGFRNPSVPAKTDILAIGDSLTWGYGALMEESWPRVVGKLSGRTVYNMSVPTYGTLQYWALLEEGLRLSPRTVVIVMYPPNDMYDAYRLAYESDQYKDLRDPAAPPDIAQDTIDAAWREGVEKDNAFKKSFRMIRVHNWLNGHLEIVRVLSQAGLWPDVSF